MEPCEVCEKTPKGGATARVKFHLEGLEAVPGRPRAALGRRTWKVCAACGETLRTLLATHGLQTLKNLVNQIGGDST